MPLVSTVLSSVGGKREMKREGERLCLKEFYRLWKLEGQIRKLKERLTIYYQKNTNARKKGGYDKFKKRVGLAENRIWGLAEFWLMYL